MSLKSNTRWWVDPSMDPRWIWTGSHLDVAHAAGRSVSQEEFCIARKTFWAFFWTNTWRSLNPHTITVSSVGTGGRRRAGAGAAIFLNTICNIQTGLNIRRRTAAATRGAAGGKILFAVNRVTQRTYYSSTALWQLTSLNEHVMERSSSQRSE